jgi:hypothetical protein
MGVVTFICMSLQGQSSTGSPVPLVAHKRRIVLYFGDLGG